MLHFLEQTIQRYVYKIQFSNCHIVPISKSHTCYNLDLDVLHMIHVRVLVEIRTVYVRVCSQARRDPVYVQARSTRSRAYDRMCASSSRFMRNTAVRARRNLVCLVENTIPRRDLAGYRDWIENPRRDHLE